MSKIHITGANGYIGALLVDRLISDGHEVEIATYRLPNIPIKSINTDIVIHLAFSGGGTEHKPRVGEGDTKQMHRVNIEGMKALFLGIKKANTKIIFISSTAVYGKFYDSPLLDEEAELAPVSEYGRHKVEAENILRNSKFDWLILRPCTIFGPSIDRRFGNSFLNVVVSNAIKKGEITVLGGDQMIDTLYILDLVNIIMRLCSGEWYPCETFNIGGEIVKVKSILTVLADALTDLGFPCSISFKEYNNKPGIHTDTKKLIKTFSGWTHSPLKTSIHAFVSDYIKE